MMLISVGSALGPAEARKVKMLAIGSPKRLPQLPDLPSTGESVPGYTAGTWFGLSATGGTPRDVVMKINADVREIIAQPAIQEQFITKQLYEPMDQLAGGVRPVHQVRNPALGQGDPRAEPEDRALALHRSSPRKRGRTERASLEPELRQGKCLRTSHSMPFQPMQTASPAA